MPSEVEFSGLSGIDCLNRFSKFDREHAFSSLFRFWYIYQKVKSYVDENRNKLEKACSRPNFKKRLGVSGFWEPEKFNLRGQIFRKKIENFFYDLLKLKVVILSKKQSKTLSYRKLWKHGMSNFLLITFLIFVNILMLNMIIALFTNTYERIKAESKINLANAKFSIVVSMTHTLPFSFFNPFIQLFLFIWALISVPIAICSSG